MERVSIMVSATALAASVMLAGQACSSSDDTESDVGNLMGTGGMAPTAAGGSTPTGVAGTGGGSTSSGGATSAPTGVAGTEGSPPVTQPPAAGGGSNVSAGAAGAAGGMAGGAAGAAGAPTNMGGTGGVPVPPPETACPAAPSPSDGVACVFTCTDGCGVHSLGSRVCTCSGGLFDCATCDFTGVDSPLVTPPDAPLEPCALVDEQQEDDESGCEDNERCQSIGREDGSSGANRFCGCLAGEWDCDTKPVGFP